MPLKFAYELSLALVDERVPVPGALMSGLIRLLPSAVTGPRLLNPAMVSLPVISAPPSRSPRKFPADLSRWNNSARRFALQTSS